MKVYAQLNVLELTRQISKQLAYQLGCSHSHCIRERNHFYFHCCQDVDKLSDDFHIIRIPVRIPEAHTQVRDKHFVVLQTSRLYLLDSIKRLHDRLVGIAQLKSLGDRKRESQI